MPSNNNSVEIKCEVHFALPKRPKNQFQPVWQSRQQVLTAYCPNIYTVDQRQSGIISKSGQAPFWSFENFFMTANLAPFFLTTHAFFKSHEVVVYFKVVLSDL
jgi:hypothetical protein